MSLLDNEEDILKESEGLIEKIILTEFMEKYMGASEKNYLCFYEYFFNYVGSSLMLMNAIISKPILHNNIIYPLNGGRLIIKGFKSKDFIYKNLPIQISDRDDVGCPVELLLLDCHPELLKEGIPGIKITRQFNDDWKTTDWHTLKKISGEVIDRQNI